MKTHTVLTPANTEIVYRLAGAGSRLAAFVIDLALQAAVCLLPIAAVFFFGFRGATPGGTVLALLIIACFAVHMGYFIVCETLMNGQSFGKKILGLRVIRENGQPVGFMQSLVRGLFRTGLDMLYVGIFCILFSQKHKRFGDMAAGTVVVSEHMEPSETEHWEKDTQHGDTLAYKTISRFAPSFTHIRLSPDEHRVLRSYLRRKEHLPDKGAALRKQWANYLAGKWQIDAALIDDDVLTMIGTLR